MKISNRQFGTIEVNDGTILDMEGGLIGFETLRRFALVESPGLAPFQWLLAVDEPEMTFPVVNVMFVDPAYEAELAPADRRALGLDQEQEQDLAVIVIANVMESGVTVNLRGPIVINGATKKARQVIQHNAAHRIDAPLSQVEDSEDGDAMEGTTNARTHTSAG